MASPEEMTQLLVAWSKGDREALEKLMPLVYDELHRMASNYLRGERPDHILQTTALVHEAYIRLIDSQNVQWQDRAHFFAISAQLMRRILVSHARSQLAAKRGGRGYRLTLSEAADLSVEPSQERDLDIVALDNALNRLAARDERKSKIVELRYFGGLSLEETAEVLGISPGTIKREWRMARAWLYSEIENEN
jgi:RNA polymerase sigma-70 factor, ECF subfamily